MESSKFENVITDLEWFSFLEILLNKTQAKFTLLSREGQIVIQSNKVGIDAISERLHSVLGSAQNFLYFLPYEIANRPKPNSPVVVDKAIFDVKTPENTVKEGMRIFDAIFKAALAKLRFNGFFEEENSTVVDGVLWSQPIEPFLKPLWELALKTALASFSHVTVDALREAWNGNDSQLNRPSKIIDETVIAEGPFNECLGYLHDTDENDLPRSRIFFNFLALYKHYFPPIINSTEIPMNEDENTYEISFEIDRFVKYFQQHMQKDGVVLKVFKNKEDAKLQASPIFITSENLVKPQKLHLLVIDRSQSMKNDLERLKKEVNLYIDELRKKDPNSRVRIVIFAKSTQSAEFPISQKRSIDDFIQSIRTESGTYLYTTIDEELNYLAKINQNFDIRMVVFTDGQDSTNTNWNDFESRITSKMLALNKDGKTLQILPIGAGKADPIPLTAMAKTCGTSYTYLQKASSLTGCFREISTSHPMNKLIDFVVKLQKSTQTYRLAIPQTGGPHIPHVTFPLLPDEHVSIKCGNNQELCFFIHNINEIPQKTLVDELRDYVQQATKIAIETSKSITTRLSELEKLLLEVASLKTSQHSEVVLVANVKNEIQTQHINPLKQLIESPEQAAATISRIGAITSVTHYMISKSGSSENHLNNSNN